MGIQQVADRLNLSPEELEKESLKAFLFQKLRHIEAEIFEITSRHGIKDVLEMDRLIKEGKLHEKESWEDFFKLDNLEAEREKIDETLKDIV